MAPNWHHLLAIFMVVLVGEAAGPAYSRRNIAEGDPLVMNAPAGLDSTPKRLSTAGEEVPGDADVVPTPAPADRSFMRLLAFWGIIFAYRAIARKRKERALQTAAQGSTDHVPPSPRLAAECSPEKAALYREVMEGYNRLKDGTASTGAVDALRRSARSYLEGRDGHLQNELREVKELLVWLDNARTSGRITITVQQLRERKMGSWDIECGIDAGGRTIKVKKNVKGDAEVGGCVLNVPWDASGNIKVWMHLAESGYETCWGHFGPITMSSAEVLQDSSGMSRAFHTDQFDKDFKAVFNIQRNFNPLPCFSNNMAALKA